MFGKIIVRFIKLNWIFLLFIVVAFILRIINLFNNPQIFVDENLYISRAWSFFRYQSIDIFPLGYDYDHPFFGWIFLSLFIQTFPAILYYENLRIIMVIMNIIEIGALYSYLNRKLDRHSALVSTIFLGFLEIYIKISRMVLIDNIATFLLILSLTLYQSGKRRWLSSILLGLSILTKYTYIIFIPGFFYIMLIEEKYSGFLGDSLQGIFKSKIIPFVKILGVILLVFSIWFIYALIRGELIGSATEYGLIAKLLSQIQRGDFIPFWESNSYFLSSFNYFTSENPFIIIIPLLFVVVLIFMIRNKFPKAGKHHELLILNMIFLIPYLLFLMRGSYTYFFYLIPLFPFLAMIISNGYSILKNWVSFKIAIQLKENPIKKKRIVSFTDITIFGLILAGTIFPFQYNILFQDRNTPLYEMRDYVIDNLPITAVYATMGHFLPEFQEGGYSKMFLYWRCNSYDPIFNKSILLGNWKNIDYFIIDSSTENILRSEPYIRENHTYQAFIHSVLLISFGEYSDKISIFMVNDV